MITQKEPTEKAPLFLKNIRKYIRKYMQKGDYAPPSAFPTNKA